MSHKTDRIRITPDIEQTIKDEAYDGYYDDVLPTDTGEYRQGLDQKTVRNIIYLLIGVVVVVGLCIILLYYS